MRRALAAAPVLWVLVLTGCATPTPTFQPRIADAVRLQDAVIADPLFREVFMELDQAGAVIWEAESLTVSAAGDASRHPSPTRWLLDRYADRGGFALGVVSTWRKWNPWSSTNAATVPGRDATRLNSWNLGPDGQAIAPTLIHERVHSFGQVHAHGQYKQPNQCDAAYIAGDLAEALLARSSARPVTEPHVCPALCEALRRRNLPTSSRCRPDA